MEQIQQLMNNKVFWVGVTSWAVAQVLKAVIHAFLYKSFELERLFGDGGMPSGHSATVASVTTACALIWGLDSFEFAISAMVAIIVMHDAMGVRLETGKQSKILNELMDMFSDLNENPIWTEKKLKEFVGHTPFQVLAGCILGIVMGFIMV